MKLGNSPFKVMVFLAFVIDSKSKTAQQKERGNDRILSCRVSAITSSSSLRRLWFKALSASPARMTG
jgi:hypothetical protein